MLRVLTITAWSAIGRSSSMGRTRPEVPRGCSRSIEKKRHSSVAAAPGRTAPSELLSSSPRESRKTAIRSIAARMSGIFAQIPN